MQASVSRSVARFIALLLTVGCTAAWSAAISLTGQLDPANAQDVFLYPFTLSAPTSISVQSWGYGGTLNAPGGTNANGVVITPGGFDPYVSLFAGTGAGATFIASNDDGACPPGTAVLGNCFDSTLTINLGAGNYTLAVSSFLNMSFAENLGTGTLGDGFIGLGSFGDRSNAYAVDISGTSVVVPARALTAQPNALTFGAQTLNTSSGPSTVTITSTGSAPVTIGAITVGGANASEFTVGGNCAAATLSPGSSCTLSVTFRPTVLGPRAAAITLNSNADSGSLLVNVAGTGVNTAVAAAGLSATDVNFGDTVLQTSSAPRSVLVTNIGSAPLTIGADTLTGVSAGDFTGTDGCTGQTLQPGQSCMLTFVFTPHALGPQSAIFTFNSDASNNPVAIILRGVGVLPHAIPALGYWGLVLLCALLLASGLRLAGRCKSRS